MRPGDAFPELLDHLCSQLLDTYIGREYQQNEHVDEVLDWLFPS